MRRLLYYLCICIGANVSDIVKIPVHLEGALELLITQIPGKLRRRPNPLLAHEYRWFAFTCGVLILLLLGIIPTSFQRTCILFHAQKAWFWDKSDILLVAISTTQFIICRAIQKVKWALFQAVI